jgi:hypothetical protein
MGPDGAIGSNARAPINLFVAKDYTEAVVRCWPHAAGVTGAPMRQGRAACISAAVAAAPLLRLEPLDTVPAHQGWGAPGHLVRTLGQDDRYIVTASTPGATGVQHSGRSCFPISKISRHSNGEDICAIRYTGRTPLIGIVQHAGSAKPRSMQGGPGSSVGGSQHPPKASAACSHQWRENSRESCPQSESEIQAALVGGIGGPHKPGAGVVTVTRIITRLSPWTRPGAIRSGWRSRTGFVNRRSYSAARIARSEERRVKPSMPDRCERLGGAFH